MTLARFLGCPVRELLGCEPFSRLSVVRMVVDEPPRPAVRYAFEDGGCEVVSDEGGIVEAIIVRSGACVSAAGVSFANGPHAMAAVVGPARASGPARPAADGRAYGPWERFELEGHVMHVEYRLNGSGIERLTLIGAQAMTGLSPAGSG